MLKIVGSVVVYGFGQRCYRSPLFGYFECRLCSYGRSRVYGWQGRDRLLANASEVFSTSTVVSNFRSGWSTGPEYATKSLTRPAPCNRTKRAGERTAVRPPATSVETTSRTKPTGRRKASKPRRRRLRTVTTPAEAVAVIICDCFTYTFIRRNLYASARYRVTARSTWLHHATHH